MHSVLTNQSVSHLSSCFRKTVPMIIADVSQLAITMIFLQKENIDVPIVVTPFVAIMIAGSAMDVETSIISAALVIKLGELFLDRRPTLLVQYATLVGVIHVVGAWELLSKS